MAKSKVDPDTIKAILGFKITPGRQRVIFQCRNDKDEQVTISEDHLQAGKPNLVYTF
ncbi:hypothetical protein ACHAPA_006649 [Fusarium lateritium]